MVRRRRTRTWKGDVGRSLTAEICAFECNPTTFNAAAQFLGVVWFVVVGSGKWFRVLCFVEIVVDGVHTYTGREGTAMTSIGPTHPGLGFQDDKEKSLDTPQDSATISSSRIRTSFPHAFLTARSIIRFLLRSIPQGLLVHRRLRF